jgi:hypothetical protein
MSDILSRQSPPRTDDAQPDARRLPEAASVAAHPERKPRIVIVGGGFGGRPRSRGLGLIDERSRVLTLAQRDVDRGVVSPAQYLSSLAPRYEVARNGTTSPPPPS